MKGTFTATGRAFQDISDKTGYVRGGKDKDGLLKLNFGTGSVDLEISTDEGTTWVVDSTYTADETKKVSFVGGPEAIYTLNCTAYTADITYFLSS